MTTQGLPDFIIIGAMKSGTSSLHEVLAEHPDVYIPPGEIFFFDVDDVEQHPDFFVPTRGGWSFHDFERDFETYLEWYRSLFQGAGEGQLIGEDSTTYIASRLAAPRIARVLPDAKLLAILRDPVSRTYSHYWHNVAAGRATMTFERTIHRTPGSYLSRGFYREQLERYVPHFGPDRLKVLAFESFVSEPQEVVDEVCGFLGLSGSVDVEQVNLRRNPARPPVSLPVRLLVNRVVGSMRSRRYTRRIPNMPGYEPGSFASTAERHPAVKWLSDRLESVPSRRPPPMKPSTREFLEKLFRKRNAGLSELVDIDLVRHWPWMR